MKSMNENYAGGICAARPLELLSQAGIRIAFRAGNRASGLVAACKVTRSASALVCGGSAPNRARR